MPAPAEAQGSVAGDREALVALYNATNGDSWTRNANWKSNKPLGEWFGVTTNADGRVTALTLFFINASGSIPADLGNLSELTVLEISGNRLTGPIPPILGNLSNLTRLDLSLNNQLTGSIPPELGNLSNLAKLELNLNRFTGAIPSTLGGLSKLTRLNLHSNQLTGPIPPELGNLSNLRELYIAYNRLTGSIPPELGNLSNLSNLTLFGNNNLTGCVPYLLRNLVAVTSNFDEVVRPICPPIDRRDAELILAGTARSMASDAVDVMTGRFDSLSTDDGSQMTLAGHVLRLDLQGRQEVDPDPWHGIPIHGDAAWWDDRQQAATALSAHDLLTRSSFILALDEGESGEGASGLTLWGRGSMSDFAGSPDAGLNMNGSFGSGWLGLDYRVQPSVLVGLAVTHGAGTVDHGRTGRLETETDMTLTSVLPYAYLQMAPGLELWGMFGAGHGNMEVSTGGNDILATELVSFMRAMGGRQALTNLAGIDLAARVDAFSATLHTEATAELPEASGSAQRVRLLVEGSRASGQVVSRFTLGGRWDGGTADTGVGLEVGGGLAWTQAAMGLNVELQGRYLLAHTANGYEDWGASLDLRFDPGVDERGLMFSLSPAVGDVASGAERLYGDADLTDLAANDNRTGRLEAELAYGVAGFGGAGMVTPYGGLTLDGTDAARHRLGGRVALGSSLDLTVEGNRTERDGASVSHGVSVQFGLWW